MTQHLLDESLYAEEREIECDGIREGARRYREQADDAVRRGDGANLKPVERLLVHWFTRLSNAIANEKRQVSAGRPGVGRHVYGEKILILPSDRMAVIAMHETVGILLDDNASGAKVAKIALAIGRSCEAEARISKIRSDDEAWNRLTHTSCSRLTPGKINWAGNKSWPDDRWPLRVKAHLGMCLLDLLLKVSTVQDHDKPFAPGIVREKRILRPGKPNYAYFLKLSERALEIIADGHAVRECLRPAYPPMVVKPMPWTRDTPGGYIALPLGMVARGIDSHKSTYPDIVFEALNSLNAQSWRVNRWVLEVIGELWEMGGKLAGIPRAWKQELPPAPPDFKIDPAATKEWKKAARAVRMENIQDQGFRAVFLQKFETAKRLADKERFYLPHFLDWRMRAYAAPVLSHLGDDVCRGLLEFAEPVPVDSEGRRWLEIHAANCCGIDKVSFDDRVAWVRGNLGAMEAWAKEPLEYTGWLQMEDPFQALAAAFALFNEEAAEHLPVQIDGSNNALQHYAAMLRCSETARLVNLIPSESPADVYADVAALCRQMAAQDDSLPARALTEREVIDRKIVKQTAMTKYYNVTLIGARKQIQDKLQKAGFALAEDSGVKVYDCAKYLAISVDQAMSQVCPKPVAAMNWITECGRIITRDKEVIRWKTPLDVLIEQPHRSPRKFHITTVLQQLYINYKNETCPPAVKKQVNAFVPSFVHSIDASHMFCVAVLARDAGMSFASVHDCYWSHPAYITKIGRILREQFVEIHENPAHLALYEYLKKEYKYLNFPNPPEIGDLDISCVIDSPYFFS
jgi:DNA-directed RNA polymerase